MNRVGMWSEAELETVRTLFPTGGSAAVHAALPHRTQKACGFKAWSMGIAPARRRTPKSAGTILTPNPKKLAPVVVSKPIVRDGPCDRGDREAIRRRLRFVVEDLSRELRRPASAILDAVAEMAIDRFKADALARLSVDRADVHATSSEGSV